MLTNQIDPVEKNIVCDYGPSKTHKNTVVAWTEYQFDTRFRGKVTVIMIHAQLLSKSVI